MLRLFFNFKPTFSTRSLMTVLHRELGTLYLGRLSGGLVLEKRGNGVGRDSLGMGAF